MRSILDKLEQLGFSPYEAKAYYTSLRKHPANGYEISKIGKIPASKIYETLHPLPSNFNNPSTWFQTRLLHLCIRVA